MAEGPLIFFGLASVLAQAWFFRRLWPPDRRIARWPLFILVEGVGLGPDAPASEGSGAAPGRAGRGVCGCHRRQEGPTAPVRGGDQSSSPRALRRHAPALDALPPPQASRDHPDQVGHQPPAGPEAMDPKSHARHCSAAIPGCWGPRAQRHSPRPRVPWMWPWPCLQRANRQRQVQKLSQEPDELLASLAGVNCTAN